MKKRVLSLLMVVMIVLAAAPTVFAQGTEDMMCVGLSEADCAILMEATAKSEEIESFFMDFSVDMTLSNLGAVAMMMGETEEVGDITMNIAGNGPFMTDMTVMPPARMAMTVDAEVNDGTEVDGGNVQIVIADGVIYSSEDAGATWEGITFEDALNSMDPSDRAMIEGLLGGDLSELPEGALSPNDLAAGSPFAMLEEFGLSEEAIMSLVDVPGFITQQRVADEEMMGQTMIVFESVVELAPLFASEEFATVLNGVMAVAAEEDPSVAEMGMMVPMLLSGLDVTITQTQYIGADDMYVHGLGLDFLLSFDLSMLMGGGEGGQEIPPIVLDFQFDVTLDQINEAFDITAPEGAVMLSADSM